MKTEISTGKKAVKSVAMSEMKPCQVGWADYNDERVLVMRTANQDRFEVMDLTNFKIDSCWNDGAHLSVKLITEPVTLTFIP
jgi:hypothetical protein